MIRPARTIWDTRIQCVCGIITAREADDTEVYLSANFGQVSLDPPRLIINPNRVFPIEGIIRRTGRFSVSVLAHRHRALAIRLIRLRRRQPGKANLAGLELIEDERGIPWMRDALATVFCEVEKALDTGDHTVIIARVLSSENHFGGRNDRPLLYREIMGNQPEGGGLLRGLRRGLAMTPIPDLVRRSVARFRPPPPADLPAATYRDGGFTEAELAVLLSRDMVDRRRVLRAPALRSSTVRSPGVCVVGTRWGASQCDAVRAAAPDARLFLCGRDPARTARMAARYKATGWFQGLEAALADDRVRAVVLALPHHLHRDAALAALAAGKDVLVEKPIANTLDDADRMIAAARQAGRILMVAENMHFRPSLGMVARRIAAGDAGEPLHFLGHAGTARQVEGWQAERDKLGGGVFMDIGIHYVRAMRLLMGEPDRVTAFRPMQVNPRMEGEDGLQVVFSSSVGWQSHILTTWSAMPGILPDIVVMGDGGTFHLWPGAGYYDYYPTAPRPLVRMLQYVRPYSLQARLLRPTMQRERVRFPGPDAGYIEQMREFLGAVNEGRLPVATAEDGRRDLELVLRTYDALETGNAAVI